MERLTGKNAQSLMEAVASVYMNEELVLEHEEYEQLDEFALWNLLTKNRTVYRRDPKTGEKIKVQQSRDFNKPNAPYADVKTTNTGDFGSAGKPKPPAPAPAPASKPDPKPAANPNVTKDGTKFERRLPTMAELRAAQAARAAAKAAGKDKAGQESSAVKAGVQQAQRQASVDASIKAANRPEVLNRQAPAGSALRAQQDRLAAQKAAQSAAKPAAAPAAAPAKPAMTAAGNKAAELAALRAKAKADTMKKSRLGEETELDIFDTIKEHLISEHELSEDVAIQVMTLLDEETKGEIMEYTASMGAGPRGTTVKMTADGKEPVGDRLLRGIKDRVGGFLRNLNPNALKSKTVEPRKPLVQQNNSFELEGELVDEGSCGSKKKKKSKKGGY